MPRTIPSIDDLIKVNPKVDRKQIAELDELAKKLHEIPAGKQKLRSPVERRRIIIGENDQSDPRTIRLTTHR